MPCSSETIRVISQLYITDKDIDHTDFVNRLDHWISFFRTYWNLLVEPVKRDFFQNHILRLDYEELLQLEVPPSVEAFKKDFYSAPEMVLSAMCAALHIYTCQRYNSESSERKSQPASSAPDTNDLCGKEVIDNELNNLLHESGLEKYIYFNEIKNKNVIVRVYNYKPIIKFINLRSHTVGCVASIVGQIIRISKPKTLITSALFTCSKCDQSFFKRFKMGLFELPTRCIYSKCDGRFFILNRHYVMTTTYQTIRLQEYMLDDNRLDNSKTNSILDIQIMDDLIGLYNLGNILNIIGVIKTTSHTGNINTYKENKLIYKMYLNTISINLINNNNAIKSNNTNDTENSNSFINDIYYNEPNRFYLVATSLFPNLRGKYYQRVGLLLSLLGGVNVYDEYNNLKKRGSIHVMLIGEPGVGKSHMLSAISSSLGNYMISGSNITNSGLTVGLVKENNEFNLEAGILVLLSNSTLCIDELDKLHSTDTLLEVMEGQKVSIAKGGIVKTLKAQTTLICALNPINSKYNLNKNVLENIKISKTLLSRFDLVFLLINDKSDYDDYYEVENSNESNLIKKLKSFKKYDLLNNVLINEYIEYGKKYVNPKFTREARDTLNAFFKELVQLYRECNSPLKITTRQLQGLIRLCQSRARGDLSNLVTREHVEEVVEVFKNTVYYPNEDTTLSGNDKTRGKKNVVKLLINELKSRTKNRQTIDNQEMSEIAREVVSKNKSTTEPDELIYQVNHLGYILKQGGTWKMNF